MDNIIATIRSKLNNPIKYRVVFDVDDVMCCSPMQIGYDIERKCATDREDRERNTEEKFKERVKQYPDSVTIY